MKAIRFGRWSLEADQHNWILNRHYLGTSRKTGLEVEKTEQTYHRDIRQVANWIINQEAKEGLGAFEGSEDLKSLVRAVRLAEASLELSLNGPIPCPRCGSESEARQHLYDETTPGSLPDCSFFECTACNHQWGHE